MKKVENMLFVAGYVAEDVVIHVFDSAVEWTSNA